MPPLTSDMHVDRVRAAARVGPLLSRRRLRDLPWPLRLVMTAIAVVVAAALLALALIPLWVVVSLIVG